MDARCNTESGPELPVPGAGAYELKRDDGNSAAEQLARLVPKACVVTAFTSMSSALIHDPASGAIPLAGDDAPAKSVVARFVSELGFDSLDVGGLFQGRKLEADSRVFGAKLNLAALQAALL